MKVYLAGPITGESYEQATDWRQIAKDMLEKHGIQGYSPMRAKEHLVGKGKIPLLTKGFMCKSKEIMTRDYHDCATCDLLFVNLLGRTTISIGTMMEIAWAYQKQIPIVACVEPDNPHIKHPMVFEAVNIIADSLTDGLDRALSILLP